MTDGGFEIWAAGLIAVGVGGAVVRLAVNRRTQAAVSRGPLWRFVVLIGLQVVCGALLYLTLFPPALATPPGRLIVATRGAPATLSLRGDTLVSLPEAGPIPGAVRAPDLATALRLYPQIGHLRIVGEGLPPRDQNPLDRPAEFSPLPPPKGFVELNLPGPLAPGGRFAVSGRIGDQPAGALELLDPAGVVVAQARVTAGGRFNLSAAARGAGAALFELRLSDTSGRPIERLEIPVEVRAPSRPRVVVLAGAPTAETKYLRRWAQDADIDLSVEIDVGGGILLGDPPTALTRETLATVDLVVVDDRRWETLSPGARAALGAAVENGLGLLLRPTGLLSAPTRRDWAALGIGLSDNPGLRGFQPGGSTAPAGLQLHRYEQLQLARDLAPILKADDGALLAAWRPRGQGRVGVWAVADSYALTLAGGSSRHGELWSALFSTLARPAENAGPRLKDIARPGERAILCAVSGNIRVNDPAGVESRPQRDPATGPEACAAYWPQRVGWHRITGDSEAMFYVHPASAAPSLVATANRQATQDLVASAETSTGRAPSRSRGSPWPWAAALLAMLSLLWWLERRLPPAPHGNTVA